MRYLQLFIVLFLTACATPEFAAPAPDTQLVAAERSRAIRAAMKTALDRRARVYDLSWPILTENLTFCPKTVPSIGVVLADREMRARLAGGLREEDLEAVGIADELVFAHVFRGSPADRAGVVTGAQLLAVNGEEVEKPEEAAAAIRQRTENDEVVELTVSVRGKNTVHHVSPTQKCDYAVKISTSQAINAHAATGDIVILTGVIRTLDDEALQYLIAHELAHLVAGHRRKYVQNTIVSGAALAGPFVYGAGWIADWTASTLNRPPDTPIRRRVGHRGERPNSRRCAGSWSALVEPREDRAWGDSKDAWRSSPARGAASGAVSRSRWRARGRGSD